MHAVIGMDSADTRDNSLKLIPHGVLEGTNSHQIGLHALSVLLAMFSRAR